MESKASEGEIKRSGKIIVGGKKVVFSAHDASILRTAKGEIKDLAREVNLVTLLSEPVRPDFSEEATGRWTQDTKLWAKYHDWYKSLTRKSAFLEECVRDLPDENIQERAKRRSLEGEYIKLHGGFPVYNDSEIASKQLYSTTLYKQKVMCFVRWHTDIGGSYLVVGGINRQAAAYVFRMAAKEGKAVQIDAKERTLKKWGRGRGGRCQKRSNRRTASRRSGKLAQDQFVAWCLENPASDYIPYGELFHLPGNKEVLYYREAGLEATFSARAWLYKLFHFCSACGNFAPLRCPSTKGGQKCQFRFCHVQCTHLAPYKHSPFCKE